MADASERIREHRERKKRSEIAAKNAPVPLAGHRQFLDSADTITAFAEDMSEFLKTSELIEIKAFVRSFSKEIFVGPGRAIILYPLPRPEDSPIGSVDNADITLNGQVMSTVRSGTPGGSHNRVSRAFITVHRSASMSYMSYETQCHVMF